MSKQTDIVRIIACEVFAPALTHLEFGKLPNVQITYLPSHLHLRPRDLEEELLKAVNTSKKNNERIICLYGECFPGIMDFCNKHNISKADGSYCYEMILGPERFRQLIDETAGTYFLEKDLILNFEEYCMIPLELHDDEMRTICFEHYKRMLYVKQPSDPDLEIKAGELAQMLGLSLETQDSDYSNLEKNLLHLISLPQKENDIN